MFDHGNSISFYHKAVLILLFSQNSLTYKTVDKNRQKTIFQNYFLYTKNIGANIRYLNKSHGRYCIHFHLKLSLHILSAAKGQSNMKYPAPSKLLDIVSSEVPSNR